MEARFAAYGGLLVFGRLSDIDLRLLRIFISVVEAGGFSLATAKLNVAESTISQHMSDLEKRLGMRLCERGRSGFRLTPNGEQVYKATLDLLSDIDRYRNELVMLNARLGGTLRIGLPDAIVTAGSSRIVAVLARFMEQFPDVAVEVATMTPRDLERKTLDGSLHAAVGPEHRRVAGLDYTLLFNERNLLYCGRSHPLHDVPDDRLTPNMMEGAQRIARAYLDRFDEGIFGTENYRASAQQIEAAAILILTGKLIGFLPDHFAAAWVASGQMRALLPDKFHFDSRISLLHRRDAAHDPKVEALIKLFIL